MKFIESEEDVGLRDSGPVGQMFARICAMSRRRVFEEGRRRTLAAERSIVAHIDPDAASSGLGLRQHQHGRVADMEAFAGQDMLPTSGSDRIEHADATADPIGKRLRGLDSKDSLFGANQIQGCFLAGCVESRPAPNGNP